MRARSKTQSIALCGLAIALLAASAFIAIPLGPVPFTLQTAVLVLILLSFTPREAIASVAGYLALGAIGLPVFSSMRGGLGVLAGATGGFLIGFLVGMMAASLLRTVLLKRGMNVSTAYAVFVDIFAVTVLLLFSYGLGFAQLMLVAHLDPISALASGVAPFVLPDIVKAAIASGIAAPVRHALGRDPSRNKAVA